jgi:hypothetical protein
VTENVDGSDHFVLVVTNWKDINERQKTIAARYPAFALGSIQSISSGFGSMAIRSRLSIDDLAWDNQLNVGP